MRSDARLVDVLRMARMRRSRTVHMDMVGRSRAVAVNMVGRSRAVHMNPLRMHMAWVMAMMVMRSQMNDVRTAWLAQGRINRNMYTGRTHRHINLYGGTGLPCNNKERSAGCNNHGFQYIRLHKKKGLHNMSAPTGGIDAEKQKKLFLSRELLTLGHFQSRLAKRPGQKSSKKTCRHTHKRLDSAYDHECRP